MKHEQKKRIARKMMTKKENKNHTSIFLSEAWTIRKIARQKKMLEYHLRAINKLNENSKHK